MEGGRSLFESLRKWSDLEDLVDEAAPEGVYLECKTQTGSRLKQGTKKQLAATVSSMSNASGGVILLGVSTTSIGAHGLDVVSELEPIGNVSKLGARVEVELSQLTVPPVVGSDVRVVQKGKSEAGVVVVYIPPTLGDPIRSAVDNHFYFRGSDGDAKAPYEVIRRLFAASDVPDLRIKVDERIALLQDDGSFTLPMILLNESSAIARDIAISVLIENPEACLRIALPEFTNVSDVNPGDTLFMKRIDNVVHRDLGLLVGKLIVAMAGKKWPRRILEINVSLYADKMRARSYRIRANLKKTGLEIKSIEGPEYLY